ncbi:MAG TPA: ATP-binding protein, partial [Candidatus Binatia bacterium]|nr:ATP-binding protein [Candidatus Binatia bacterium]
MGETRVDLLHLLEDLRDAYPGSIEETILTEIMANSLDSGATQIGFACDPVQRTLTGLDNGRGMQRRELARFHDIAASTKSRGQGIGFAGVGIKLGLLVCEEVFAETRRGKTHVATAWHLASRYRAPWKWVPPAGLVVERGTAVRLKIQNALSPLLDPGFLENVIRRQFEPLLDDAFKEVLASQYPKGISIGLNGQILDKQSWTAPLHAALEIRMLRKRKPSASGYLKRSELPLSEERRGIAVSTFGKVIKRGWDWMGMTPAAAERIGGLLEVPELAACLTLNKADFIRSGPRGATYLAYRKAIQEAVSRQLAAWGDAPETAGEAPPREVRPLQRDLAHMLEDLATDFPLLSSLVEQRAGGQKRLAFGDNGESGGERSWVAASVIRQANVSQEQAAPDAETPRSEKSAEANAEAARLERSALQLPARGGSRRPGHYGLQIDFEDRAEDLEIGRLVDSTVWVNRAHPAYRRALASRSIGYHIALAVGMSLAPLAVEQAREHQFV